MVAPGGGVGRYAALRCLWHALAGALAANTAIHSHHRPHAPHGPQHGANTLSAPPPWMAALPPCAHAATLHVEHTAHVDGTRRLPNSPLID
eukprot:4553406-Prymnesium_polylepis.1